jgi:hypothetical protein
MLYHIALRSCNKTLFENNFRPFNLALLLIIAVGTSKVMMISGSASQAEMIASLAVNLGFSAFCLLLFKSDRFYEAIRNICLILILCYWVIGFIYVECPLWSFVCLAAIIPVNVFCSRFLKNKSVWVLLGCQSLVALLGVTVAIFVAADSSSSSFAY